MEGKRNAFCEHFVLLLGKASLFYDDSSEHRDVLLLQQLQLLSDFRI